MLLFSAVHIIIRSFSPALLRQGNNIPPRNDIFIPFCVRVLSCVGKGLDLGAGEGIVESLL